VNGTSSGSCPVTGSITLGFLSMLPDLGQLKLIIGLHCKNHISLKFVDRVPRCIVRTHGSTARHLIWDCMFESKCVHVCKNVIWLSFIYASKYFILSAPALRY
jgi:hypothetical protein